MNLPHFEVSIKKRRPVNVVHLDIYLDSLPASFEGLRLVQLSDLHYGLSTPKSHIQKVIKQVISLAPNLAVLTGDYGQLGLFDLKYYFATEITTARSHILHYRRKSRKNLAEFRNLIEPLSNFCPTFAILGNHEYMEGKATVMRALAGTVEWLVNSSILFCQGQNCIQIAGLDDIKWGHPDLEKAANLENCKIFGEKYSKLEPPFFRLLLCHNPDITIHKDCQFLDSFQLVLSGHTHGGQICIPWLGPIITQTKQRHYIRGLKMFNKTAIYTCAGVGWGGIRLRLFCPPEIVLVTLKKKN